jgi:hypothetical protein
MQLKFKLRNETKGALRYEEIDDTGSLVSVENGAKIGTLYIRKSAMVAGRSFPDILDVEVTYA